jgi:hypothetical protein
MEIGQSLQLLPTPGCTPGHQTLIVRLPHGVATFSGNGVSIDNYYLDKEVEDAEAKFLTRLELEVLPMWSTTWSPQAQYDSMLIEKCIADPYMTYTTAALSGSRRIRIKKGGIPLPPVRRFTPRFRIGNFSWMPTALEESLICSVEEGG